MQTQVVNYGGFRFTRYPDSKKRTERVYFSGWVKINGKKAKKRLHVYKYLCEVGAIHKGFDIHHADGNPLNNDISNLQCIAGGKHISEHILNASLELKEFRKDVLLNVAQPKAAEWHASDEGRNWHSEQGKKNMESFKRQAICNECGIVYEAKNANGESKFCSAKCKSRHNMRIDRASGKWNESRICEYCGGSFEIYKWTKTKCCSGSCAASLRERNKPNGFINQIEKELAECL